ncbi:hypothetical protein [Mesorhizobium sp. BHbsci]
MQEIERDEIEIVLAPGDRLLQRGEVGQAGLVGNDRLAVDDGVVEAERPGAIPVLSPIRNL